jgi:hypothetical protein
MRIISPGIPQNPKLTGVCDTCYCEVECRRDEASWNKFVKEHTVICPNCGDKQLVVKEIEE